MKPKVYIETSVVSYLTSNPSRDIVTAGRQEITRQWWTTRRRDFDLYVSEFVLTEAGEGDPAVAKRRLNELQGIPDIRLTEEAESLARDLIAKGPIPQKAALDAAHIAVAVCGGIDFLLTWNFKHLANASIRRMIDRFCQIRGYEPCVICTPEELLED